MDNFFVRAGAAQPFIFSMDISLIRNFWSFPVTVMGNLSLGILTHNFEHRRISQLDPKLDGGIMTNTGLIKGGL